MRTALVIGGTGVIGQGIIEELLKSNVNVIVTSRSLEKLLEIKNKYKDKSEFINTYQVDLSVEKEVIKLNKYIKQKYNKINAIINCLIFSFKGKKIIDIELTEWNTVVKNNLTSHILIVKYLVKILNNDGSGYLIHLNNESNLKLLPMAIPMNIIAASTKIMYEALAIELVDENIKVVEIILGQIATKEKIAKKLHTPFQYTPNEVGHSVLQYVNGAKPRTTIIKLLSKSK